MPARAKAATASFPTLLEEGSVFLRIRRTQATGGSNSTAEGGPFEEAAAGVAGVGSAEAGVLGLSFSLEADGVACSALSSVSVLVSGFLGVSATSELILLASFLVSLCKSYSSGISSSCFVIALGRRKDLALCLKWESR